MRVLIIPLIWQVEIIQKATKEKSNIGIFILAENFEKIYLSNISTIKIADRYQKMGFHGVILRNKIFSHVWNENKCNESKSLQTKR